MGKNEKAPTLKRETVENLPEELNVKMKEYHCANCGRFLALQAIIEGTIAIKCRRCKELNVLDVRSNST
jgi:phage FluMu protein Com